MSLNHVRTTALLLSGLSAALAPAQQPAPEAPLPDIPTLMHQVEARQRAAELEQKDYLYRETLRVDDLDGHGSLKKTEIRQYDDFWLEGVPVRRLVSENGKELSADQQKKESDRLDKEVAKARERRARADAEGKQTDPLGHEEITVSRMLELGSFTNERRQQILGRPTLLIDFIGDPKARTRNPGENAIHEMAGTIWIDEQDRAIQHIEARFVNNFKLGGGLLVNVKKDTRFILTNIKVNDEVWLPRTLAGEGQARALLLFSINGRLQADFSGYRRFKATSVILPADPTLVPAEPVISSPAPAEPPLPI